MTTFVQDKQLTIALSGEIDHHRARTIMQHIEGKIDEYMPRICILDFRDVTFMDSSGIAVVIHALRRVRELDAVLKIANVPQQPYKVLNAAGIERVVAIEGRIL